MTIFPDANQTLFRGEYELEMEAWLRRRFRRICIVFMILGAVVTVIRSLTIVASDHPARWGAVMLNLAAGLGILAVILHFMLARKWGEATREQMLRGVSRMILYMGAVALLRENVMLWVIGQFHSDFLLGMFFWHLVACLLLPWSPLESLRAFLPLLAIWATEVLLFSEGGFTGRVLTVIFGPMILLPGLGIAALRLQYHSEQFRTRMVGKLFTTMRQELSQARSIHESMFPPPHDDGFVRFEFTYRPMRELGGDYVHLHVGAEGLVHLTILDVTGHGLAAALTVNRLYGELERIRAEAPHAEPGEVLSTLNRYIHLTMIRHHIFVTAMCLTLDPYLGKLHWANAGHPPAFLRGVNGVVTQLAATTVLLGAQPSQEFTADQRTIDLAPGDVMIVYTDGAFEARDRLGRQLGIGQLGALLTRQPAPRNWPQYLEASVTKHTGGRIEDDVLVASLTFLAPRKPKALVERAVAAT